MGDFNSSVNQKYLKEFCNWNGLTSLIKKLICFKNPDKPTCIDLILTNQPSCFQHNEWINEWKLYLSSEKRKSGYMQKWKKYKPCIKTDQIRAKSIKTEVTVNICKNLIKISI